MLSFSLFPTEHWAEQACHTTAIRWEKGNSSLFSFLSTEISWLQLQGLIAQTRQKLQPSTSETFAYIGSHRLAGLLAYLSVLAAGGRMLMLNPSLPASQLAQILSDNRVRQCLTDADFADFLPKPTACLPLPEPDFLQPATLTLTSGSTGSPKSVVHNIAQHLANAEGVCQLMNFTSKHRWLLSLPLYHVSGQGIVWRWLLKGASLLICEDKADFFPLLQQASHASLVPTQLQRYLSFGVTSGQHILLGGAQLPPELLAEAEQQGLRTYAGYGMTEMASTICAGASDPYSVGQPLSQREVTLINGEIWVKGDCLALGYWLKGELVELATEDGWFATKDRGEWTVDGRLKVLGRLDNMFISGGENIQPESVENVLFSSGLLVNIVVVPKVDREFGQRPVAFVEFLEPFSQQAVEKLQCFAKQYLEKFKQPIAYFALSAEFQQNGIKISRKQLQQYLEQYNEVSLKNE